MKIGVHVYFRAGFGGGERWLLTAAEALRQSGEVDFLSPAAVDLRKYESAFALDLGGVRALARPRKRLHGLRDWLAAPSYDLFLALDNHLAPVQPSLGRRGILFLQTPPYPDPADHPMRAHLKLRTYDLIVCDSEYTQRWAIRHGTSGVPVRVLYPAVDVELYRPLAKRRIIVSVGRFFRGRHEKKHGLMIDCFRRLVASGLEGWELHLAGSIREYVDADVAYLKDLRRQARGLPVAFHVGAPLDEIRQLYGEASIYWHATGYGVNEEANPQYLEHFGMAIIEAMAGGAIPIVIRRGGPCEIVTDGTGFLWQTQDELVDLTRRMTSLPEPAAAPIRRAAMERAAALFSKSRFTTEVRTLAEHVVREPRRSAQLARADTAR